MPGQKQNRRLVTEMCEILWNVRAWHQAGFQGPRLLLPWGSPRVVSAPRGGRAVLEAGSVSGQTGVGSGPATQDTWRYHVHPARSHGACTFRDVGLVCGNSPSGCRGRPCPS